jgi:hypothetical protein
MLADFSIIERADILGNQFFHEPKYDVGRVFRALNLSMARPETMRILRPAGHPMPF